MEFPSFLKSFGLDETSVQRFEEEGIDEESFKLLDESTINQLIPKIGPRLKFQNLFHQYMKKNNLELETLQATCASTSVSSVASLTDTDQTYSFSPGSEIESIFNEFVNPAAVETIPPAVTSITRKRKSTESSPSSPERDEIKAKRQRAVLFPEGLETFLKSSVDGRFVLSFRENLGYKSSLPRKKLCKEVINRFLQLEHVDNVSKEIWMFEEAARAITNFFPNERKEIYFIPYKRKSETSPKKGPKGRLWSRYHNVRNLLKVGETKGIQEKNLPADLHGEEDKQNSAFTNYELLRTILEPRTRVLELWELTYEFRMQHFKLLTIEEIFEEVPVLKTEIGSELINSDFNERFPEKIDNIYLKWPKLADALLKESQQRKIHVVENAADADPSAVAVLTLPYLIPPVTLKRNKGFNWRPSRTEVQESFFFNVQSIDDVDKVITQRKQKLAWANATIQPFGVMVGPLNLIEEYRIYIADVTYKFDTLIRAFEILFKAFHALNIKYPTESHHLWCFIESMIYDMNCKNSSAASLMADIKPHLMKESD